MKIALVCTGLGLVERGFERFTEELFELIKDDIPVTLFGSGKTSGPGKISLPCLRHNGWVSVLKGKDRDHYYAQQLSYSLSFIPRAGWQGYDLVHFSEPAMGNFLFHAKRLFGFRYKLFFTDALGLDPLRDGRFFERLDFIQTLTPLHHERLLLSGVGEDKMSYVPYGFHSGRFLHSWDKAMLRKKYGIPDGQKVILSVATLNRRHKRIDYLLREAAALGDIFLLLVGYPEEPDLIELGRKLLGRRFRSLYVPNHQMPEIYALADLFVHTALIEGFCLGVAEAMCSGLAVIVHDSPHFEWLTGGRECLVDMEKEGNLAGKIREVMDYFPRYEALAKANQPKVASRFDWRYLKKDYLSLYERALSGEPAPVPA